MAKRKKTLVFVYMRITKDTACVRHMNIIGRHFHRRKRLLGTNMFQLVNSSLQHDLRALRETRHTPQKFLSKVCQLTYHGPIMPSSRDPIQSNNHSKAFWCDAQRYDTKAQIAHWTNQNSQHKQAAGAKRGKTCERCLFLDWTAKRLHSTNQRVSEKRLL